MEGFSLVNLGELAKPVNTFIEKVSDAIGVLYEPSRTVRKAKADAKAMEIMTLSDQRINDIQQRALRRFVHEETKKQENIESIIEYALPNINSNAESESLENDWLVRFFDNAKLISDNEMQLLWSKILAGETNKPGTFSKNTLNILSNLDKEDALLFTNLRKYSFGINDITDITTVIFDSEDDIYKKNRITFNSLTHLDSLGLLRLESTAGFMRMGLPKEILVYYSQKPIRITFPNENNNSLEFGLVLLSQAGRELTSLCEAMPEDEIAEYSKKKWREKGLTVEDINTEIITIHQVE